MLRAESALAEHQRLLHLESSSGARLNAFGMVVADVGSVKKHQ